MTKRFPGWRRSASSSETSERECEKLRDHRLRELRGLEEAVQEVQDRSGSSRAEAFQPGRLQQGLRSIDDY